MIIVQYSDVPNCPLLAATKEWHSKQAKKRGYEFLVVTEPLDRSRHSFWQKPLLLRQVLRDGHKDVVWLDSDALWLGDELNPEIDVIGATLCFHPEPFYNHHNAGVLYMKSSFLDLIDQWIDEPDDGHIWGDNWALKKLVDRGVVPMTTLDAKWNSFEHYPAHRSEALPKVAAWHGYPGDRAQRMSDFIRQYTRFMQHFGISDDPVASRSQG